MKPEQEILRRAIMDIVKKNSTNITIEGSPFKEVVIISSIKFTGIYAHLFRTVLSVFKRAGLSPVGAIDLVFKLGVERASALILEKLDKGK